MGLKKAKVEHCGSRGRRWITRQEVKTSAKRHRRVEAKRIERNAKSGCRDDEK